MNPRLVKFAVELQTGEKVEKKEEAVKSKEKKSLFNFAKAVYATVPVNKH